MECLQCPTGQMGKRGEELYCSSCKWWTTEENYNRLKVPAGWDIKGARRVWTAWEKQWVVPIEPLSPPPPETVKSSLTFSGIREACRNCEDTSGCELREFWLLAALINDQTAFGHTQRAIGELQDTGLWLDGRRAKVYKVLKESQLHGLFGDVVFMGERLKKDRLASFFVDHWKYEPESGAGIWLGSLLKRLENCGKREEENGDS